MASFKDISIQIAIGLVTGLAVMFVTIYFTNKERQPTFYVEPVRGIIIDKTNFKDQPFKIFRKDLGLTSESEIKENVATMTFYFFNQGSETIKAEDVYSPVTFHLDSGNILNLKLLKVSRPECAIIPVILWPSDDLEFQFTALEKNDGFAAQIIYEGSKNAELKISAGIKGSTEFKNELENIDTMWYVAPISIIIYFILILVLRKFRTQWIVSVVIQNLYFIMLTFFYVGVIDKRFPDHKVPETIRIAPPNKN